MTQRSMPFLTLPLRQLLLLLLLVGILGLAVELLLLRHAESFSQLLPHITLALGLVSTATVYFRPTRATLKVFILVMLGFLVIGLLGVYFHLRGNVEFAVERDPALKGATLAWKVLRGATPALAPGALAQLGLLGLVYTYRHPTLVGRNNGDPENVEKR